MKQILLKKGKEISLQRKHPWVFSGAVAKEDEGIENGEHVEVLDSKQRFLGIGHYQNYGSIRVRILSFVSQSINTEFWSIRIALARSVREEQGLPNETTNIYRLIHGEGDFCPGLIIDVYGSVAVIQCHTMGMYRERKSIKEALIEVFKDKLSAIYDKSADVLKNVEGLKNEYLFQSNQMTHASTLENDIVYAIDWEQGQKTGFFIDQRVNREYVQHFSKGKRVLNTFCYSGGFSLAALKGGAEYVLSVDSSADALKSLEGNLKLNPFVKPDRHDFKQADVIKTLKDIPGEFDCIILDPPAFAKSRKAKHKAVQAYKRLNKIALERIAPGGILFTFSCSQVIDKMLFRNSVTAAAIEVGRNVRIIKQLEQPGDHPVNVYHPEGEYLKGLILYVE